MKNVHAALFHIMKVDGDQDLTKTEKSQYSVLKVINTTVSLYFEP